MTVINQKLYNVIENLPEDVSVKVLEYIEFLAFSNATKNAPKEIVVEDDKDLRKKLEEGMQDFESGNVCSLKQAYNEVKEMLAN